MKYFKMVVLGIFFLASMIFESCYPVKVIVVDAEKPLKVEVVNVVTVDTTGAIPVRVVNGEQKKEGSTLMSCEFGRVGIYNNAMKPCVNGFCYIVTLSKEVNVMKYKPSEGDFFVKKIGPFSGYHYPLEKDEFLTAVTDEKAYCEYSFK